MNLFKKGLLFTFSSLFMFTSCTSEEEKTAFEKWGGDNAFWHAIEYKPGSLGGVVYRRYQLQSKNITFYYDDSVKKCSFFSNFEDIFRYFDHSKNKDWNVDLNIKFEYVPGTIDYEKEFGNYSFVIRYVEDIIDNKAGLWGETNVETANKNIKKDGEIKGAYIRISSELKFSIFEKYRNKTIFHELGHAFGLKHITEDEMIGYTVMRQGEVELKETDFGYPKFDLANLRHAYGEYKEEPAPSTSKPTAPNRNNPPPRNYVFEWILE